MEGEDASHNWPVMLSIRIDSLILHHTTEFSQQRNGAGCSAAISAFLASLAVQQAARSHDERQVDTVNRLVWSGCWSLHLCKSGDPSDVIPSIRRLKQRRNEVGLWPLQLFIRGEGLPTPGESGSVMFGEIGSLKNSAQDNLFLVTQMLQVPISRH